METLFFFQGSMLVFGGVSGIFCFFLILEFKVESRCGAAGAAFGGIVHFEKLVGRRGRAGVFGKNCRKITEFFGFKGECME